MKTTKSQFNFQSGQALIPLALVVDSFMEVLEKKDSVTSGHSRRVAWYASQIATQFIPVFNEQQMDELRISALLHDIGKVGVADAILKKKSSLLEEEWPAMKSHPQLGRQMLSFLQGQSAVLSGIIAHHERWDGKGYPLGLSGLGIPVQARIIAVADAFDALTSQRPYNRRVSPAEARAIISQESGHQFCPEVVQAFLKTI